MISKKLIKKLSKRLLALFLVVIMSLSGYAAVVGDNDGSAFITKAEFDSLKIDFQNQIDQYNTSIDDKIDGAIAAYLSGINIASQEKREPLITNYDAMRWQADWFVYGEKRSWTDNHTYTRNENIWFTPHADRRIAVRQQTNNLQVYDKLVADMVDVNVRLQGVVKTYDRCCWGHWGGGFEPTEQPPSVFYLYMTYDNSLRDYVINYSTPYMNVDQIYADWTATPHKSGFTRVSGKSI